jgi:hypothetical protein
MNVPYNYVPVANGQDVLYRLAGKYLEQLLLRMENGRLPDASDHRIRVLFSVDVLAYFFKLLHRANVLDAGPVTQLMIAISKNFVTVGMGQQYLSPGSITTKYKQVVQSTARTVRALLVKMLKLLDEEFVVI